MKKVIIYRLKKKQNHVTKAKDFVKKPLTLAKD